MPRKPKALASVSESDARWVDLKTWINEQLSSYSSPRVSDIILQGKRLGLKAKEVRALLQANVPEYRQTTSKVYQSQKRSRVYNTRQLGILACDIAFFGKIEPELGRLSQTYMAGCLVARDILSRYCYAVPLKHGKTAQSIKAAFLKLFEMHDAKRDYPIRAILFDGEKGVSSLIVRALLQERRIALHVYEYSKVKSAMAEGLIEKMRATFERFGLHGNERKWHQAIEPALEDMNGRKLIINGKAMSFSANEINKKTLGKFLSELERLNPVYLFSHYSVDTSMLDFKYKVGTHVAFKQKAISSSALEKRSEVAVDSEEWVIVKRVGYFSMRMKVVPCYVIQSLVDNKQMVATEDQIVQIEPAVERDYYIRDVTNLP